MNGKKQRNKVITWGDFMNKAYFPKDNDTSFMQQLNYLYHGAKEKDEFFDEDNYRWWIGGAICNNLEVANNITNYYEGEKRTLFGIAVGWDYQNPYRMELWKNITNDV